VVTTAAEIDRPVHGVVDTVGGPWLVAAHQLLGRGGTLVAVGQTGGEPEMFDPGALVSGSSGHERTIVGFYLFDTGDGLGTDMSWLAGLIATGRLDPQVARRDDWSKIGDVIAAVAGRGVAGKAVLQVR
jgi:NADPH2:quinone reductase